MQTRCPQCQTVTPLEADRPDDKGGAFQCPSCAAKFDAYAHLTDAEPGSTPDPGADAREQGDLFVRSRTGEGVPRFARRRVRVAAPSAWRWWLACALLLVVLLAVVPVADRNELADNPEWRPRVQSLCHFFGCALPPWHDPKSFEITAREFNRHPSTKEALLVTVSFRNNAAFAQAWPLMEVSASDLNGRVIGMRRFPVKEYLGGTPETPLIEPGQSASATLEIVDPGAVSWDIEFR